MDNDLENHVQHVFDSYCKKIVRNEAIDIRREYARFNKRQSSLETLLSQGQQEPYYYDEYSTDYELFLILGFEILIKNEQVSHAIKKLTENKRRIILLRYFAGFNDREISEILGMDSKTIWYQRSKAIEELKFYLGGSYNDKK